MLHLSERERMGKNFFFSKQKTELELPKMIWENLPITIHLENVSYSKCVLDIRNSVG